MPRPHVQLQRPLRHADKMLYKAKRAGRDRIEFALV